MRGNRRSGLDRDAHLAGRFRLTLYQDLRTVATPPVFHYSDRSDDDIPPVPVLWDVCLDNFPEGRFEGRVLSPADARAMIRAARGDNELTCVSNDDLVAPYRQG
jgi:hypothetical protein